MRAHGPDPDAWLCELYTRYHHLDPAETPMGIDVNSYLPFDLLVKVDIAAMASSLEARSPFLDHEVMDLAAHLPTHYKLNGRQSKHLLKHVFADLLPPEIRFRGKSGFGVPMSDWLKGPLNGLMRDTLSSRSIKERGLLQDVEVQRMVEEHTAGRGDHSAQLWCLMMLELWYRDVVPNNADQESVVRQNIVQESVGKG